MSIHKWSLTRFWAMASGFWLAALATANLTGDIRGGRLLAVMLAATPGFLAGAWAGSHPEIRDWPLIRMVSMWLFPTLGVIGASGVLGGGAGIVALAIFAPVAILTVRWFELRGGRGARTFPSVLPDTPIPATTPGRGTPIA